MRCCCHPVSLMIAAIVVPCGRLNRAITLACLVAARVCSPLLRFRGPMGAVAGLRRFADGASGFFVGASPALSSAMA